MQEAIDYYNDLLVQQEYLNSTQEILQSNSEQLSVAGRPTCNVLRPCFIGRRAYDFVQNASSRVMQAISMLGRLVIADDHLRKQLDLTPEEETIVRLDTRYGAPDVSARLDGFLGSGGEFHFVEYNADSPGGLGYGDALSEVFSGMPILKTFAKRFPYRTIPVRSLTYNALLSAYKRWGGRDLPNIAIIDWRDAPTYNEFLLFLRYFSDRGCEVKIGAPEEVEYRNGRLWIGDFRIDLLYKRVVVGEFLARYGLQHPIIDAVRNGSVCMANGFGVQMLFKKSMFALLSDPQYSSLLPADLTEAIGHHIPWTRKLQELKTTYADKTIDLIPFVHRNRDRLVLKPNGEYGGKGVLLGWECSDADWDCAVERASRPQSSYIVQERVPIGSEIYPGIVDGKLLFQERFFDLDPYVWDGTKTEGCGVRLSRLALLNVSAGGGSAAPLFIIN
jgi:hypothetical protein